VEGTVGIGAIPQGFGLAVELRMALPGLSHREAEALVYKAHKVCPHAHATRDTIAVRMVRVASHVSRHCRPRARLVRGTLSLPSAEDHRDTRTEGGQHGPS